MKTPEDEAFDELARKQGAWGGGFQAKQAMAMHKTQDQNICRHYKQWQHCHICDLESQVAELKAALAQPAQEPVGTLNISRYKGHLVNHDFDYFGELPDGTYSVYTTPPAAQPAQEPVECLDCGSNNVGLPATYDSLVDSVKVHPAQEQRPWVGLTEEDFSAINQSCLTKLQAATSAESILKEKNNG